MKQLMENHLAFTAISVFILGIVIMFMILVRMFTKKSISEHIDGLNSPEQKKTPGYYRLVFIIGGLITLAMMFFIKYLIL